jgi:prevent-host-death family protein
MKSRLVIALTDARAKLSGIIQDVERTNTAVGISVHGDVKAYIIGADTLAKLEESALGRRAGARKTKLRGSIRIVGDLDAASQMIEKSIRQTSRQLHEE